MKRKLLQYVKLAMFWKYAVRFKCHRSLWPCQFTDHPMDGFSAK